MKRVSRERRRYSIIVTRKRTERALTRAQRRRAGRLLSPPVILEAPAVFGVFEARGLLTRFLQQLRVYTVLLRRRVLIDFRYTRKMSAAGTLLFAAELDRINSLSGNRRPMRCTYPRNVVVAQVLQHVKIFDLLKQKRRLHITADNVRFWQVHSGNFADGASAHAVIASYGDLFPDAKRGSLYRGMTEAMLNCQHHAYEEERGDGLPHVKKWWMFSQIKDGELDVAICDLGIGIPRSLKRTPGDWLQRALEFLVRRNLPNDDGNLIKAAMEVGRTTTRQKHRGKGLMDIRSVLDALGGRLQIHSDTGFYSYDAQPTKEECRTYSASIGGTLVLWKVPLDHPQDK